MGPDGKIIMENSKERQLDSVFTAKTTGEYSFCFNNEMSTFAEKMVDFEIAVRGSFPDAGRMLLALWHSQILLQSLYSETCVTTR